jgi:hypothetical protein
MEQKSKKNGYSSKENRKNGNTIPPAPNVNYIPELTNCVFKVGGGVQFQSQREILADYCKHELKNIIAWHLVLGREMAPTEPTEPAATANKVVLAKFNTKLKHFLDKSDEYDNIKALVFGTVKRQCDPLVRSHLTSSPDFEQLEVDGNVVELLNRIKLIVNKQLDGQYPHWKLTEDMRLFFCYKMHSSNNVHTHATKWKELLKGVTSRWGDFGPTNLEPLQTPEEERNKLHACLFLNSLDHGRYGHVIQELNNDYLLAQTGYPKSVDDMVIYLDSRMERTPKFKPGQRPGTQFQTSEAPDNEGTNATSFHQTHSTSNKEDEDEITDAQFHQHMDKLGISFHDFSFCDDSGSDSDVGWPSTNKKCRKSTKNKKR